MKGDFSRDTFDSKKHYNRVLMQQGRVQTDADWNEQQAITACREQTETKDVIGACGAPVHDPGFHIVASADDLSDEEKKLPGNQNPPKLQGSDFLISAGRFYVDGILCENEQIVPFTNQPDFPNGKNPLDLFKDTKLGIGVVYIDVWQRHLTALDDDYIREKALGGPDTATRVKTVWQVKVLPVKSGADRAPTCDSDFAEWDALVAPSSGMLNAHTTLPPSDNVCLVPPSAGYTRLENQLYRVEVHQGGNLPNDPVTFKWSRDNGTVVTSITNISGQDVSVHDVGPDDVLGFANGQWVEVTDDSLELTGLPGELIQIQNVNAATKTVTLQSAPTLTFQKEFHPKLRRWDGAGEVKIDGTWQALEGGIEVQCSNGTYKSGDYWLIPARTATGEIEWPPFETPNQNPIAQPARGIQHHYCRLALVSVSDGRVEVSSDCRHLFPPLTELPTEQAFHVLGINWRNDDLLSADTVNAGLEISFDAPPDLGALNSGSFIVTLEPFPKSTEIAVLDTGMRNILVMEGSIQVKAGDPMTVVWTPNSKALASFQDVAAAQEPRVRVRLMGNKIWTPAGNSLLYLDGQAFGKPGMHADGKMPRIDLDLPSGSGERASDFESWFYLGVVQTKPPLQISAVRLTTVQGGAFDVKPQPSAQQPAAQVDLPLQQAQITFNRPPDPKSVNSNSVFVFTTDPTTNTQIRMPASPPVVSSNIVTLTLLGNGVPTGTLEVASGADIPTSAVTAQDDGTALDGDYNNAPGGDFLLPFSQIIVPPPR